MPEVKRVFRTTSAMETRTPTRLDELVGLSAGLGPLALAEVTAFARRAAALARQNAVEDQVAEQHKAFERDFERWLTACSESRSRSTGDPDLDTFISGGKK